MTNGNQQDDVIESLKEDKNLEYTYNYELDEDRKKEIEDTINYSARIDFEEKYSFPDEQTLHKFAEVVYHEIDENVAVDGWRMIYAVKGKVHKKFGGLRAQLYLHRENRQLVLCLKGTKMTCLGDLWTDFYNVTKNKDGGGMIDSAFTFGERVRKFTERFESPVQLNITGHSLGGYLAQMLTYTIKYVRLNEAGKAVKGRTPDTIHPHTVVFDSPSCFLRIVKISQENPVTLETFRLDITNLIVSLNYISTYSFQTGTIIFAGDKNKLSDSGFWKFIYIFTKHGLNNFKNIEINDSCFQMTNNQKAKIKKYDSRMIPWSAFNKDELECLLVVQHVTGLDAFQSNDLPNFSFNDGLLASDTLRIRQFVPKMRHFLRENRAKFDNLDVKIKIFIETVKLNLKEKLGERVGTADIAFKFSEEHLVNIERQSKLRISCLEQDRELVATILLNSLPANEFNCIISHERFERDTQLKEELRENFLGTCLVIILNENNQSKYDDDISIPERAKLIYIGGEVDPDDDVMKIEKLTWDILDNESKTKLKDLQLSIYNKSFQVSQIFDDSLLNELPLIDVLTFERKFSEEEIIEWDERSYIDQSIRKHEKVYKNPREFTDYLGKEDCSQATCISSNAGMGKSTYIRKVSQIFMETLDERWVIKVALDKFNDDFYEMREANESMTKEKALQMLIDKVESSSAIGQKLLRNKLEPGKCIVLLDAFDEVCPYYRPQAKSFIRELYNHGLKMVVSTRPQEEEEIRVTLESCDFFNLVTFDAIQQETYLENFWGRESVGAAKKILEFLRKDFTELAIKDEDFWGIPLQLRIVAEAFPHGEISDVHRQNHDLFEIFIERRIRSTLKDKYNLDEKNAQLHENLLKGHFLKIKSMLYKLAVARIFKEGKCDLIDNDEVSNMNTIGIVVIRDSPDAAVLHEVSFMHRTFAEYLCAEALVAIMHDVSAGLEVQFEPDWFSQVLLKEDYSLVRRFMNLIIPYMANEPVHLYSQTQLKRYNKEILTTLITENLVNIFNALMQLRVKFDFRPVTSGKPHPLELALKNDLKEFAEALFKAGADIREVDCTSPGSNMMHKLAEHGFTEVIKEEFDHMQFTLNSPDAEFRTPMHYAVLDRNWKLVKFLFSEGADPEFQDYNRDTPLTLAEAQGDGERAREIFGMTNQ